MDSGHCARSAQLSGLSLHPPVSEIRPLSLRLVSYRISPPFQIYNSRPDPYTLIVAPRSGWCWCRVDKRPHGMLVLSCCPCHGVSLRSAVGRSRLTKHFLSFYSGKMCSGQRKPLMLLLVGCCSIFQITVPFDLPIPFSSSRFALTMPLQHCLSSSVSEHFKAFELWDGSFFWHFLPKRAYLQTLQSTVGSMLSSLLVSTASNLAVVVVCAAVSFCLWRRICGWPGSISFLDVFPDTVVFSLSRCPFICFFRLSSLQPGMGVLDFASIARAGRARLEVGGGSLNRE